MVDPDTAMCVYEMFWLQMRGHPEGPASRFLCGTLAIEEDTKQELTYISEGSTKLDC